MQDIRKSPEYQQQDISDQQRSDFDTVRRKIFLAKTIARLEAKPERTPVETAQLRALTATQRTNAEQKIYERMLQVFVDQQVKRLQAKPEKSATETRILEALTAVQAKGIPEEAFEQETPLTRQSFFQRLSSRGIKLCLHTLETYDVRIEIKDNKFTLLDIERSSESPVSRSIGLSGSLNMIFDEELESEPSTMPAPVVPIVQMPDGTEVPVTEYVPDRPPVSGSSGVSANTISNEKLETESDLPEIYSQLNGKVFLTQEDIPTLRAFLAHIKEDIVFVNASTVLASVKEKLDMAEKAFDEAHDEISNLQGQTGFWREEIELWRDELELELEDDKWDRKISSRKISDREIIDYLSREFSVSELKDAIYDYREEIDRFLEALHRLEERTRIENTWQPKEDSKPDELLQESRLCECDHCQITRDELNELLRESGWTQEDDEEVQKLNFTKQIEKLNEHPINQRAREILEELAPTYYEVNQALRDKIIESEREMNADYGISPWWGLDVIILLEWAETPSPIHLENELSTLWTPKTEAGWEKLYTTLPMMSESEMSYHLRWLAEPLWEPDQQPKDVLDKLCGKHLPTCRELERTREDSRTLYGDNAVQLSQGGPSADIAAFLTEPNPKTATNKLKELLRVTATGIYGYV